MSAWSPGSGRPEIIYRSIMICIRNLKFNLPHDWASFYKEPSKLAPWQMKKMSLITLQAFCLWSFWLCWKETKRKKSHKKYAGCLCSWWLGSGGGREELLYLRGCQTSENKDILQYTRSLGITMKKMWKQVNTCPQKESGDSMDRGNHWQVGKQRSWQQK